MSKVIQLPDPDAILRQACDWVAKLDAGAMSEDDKAALIHWLDEDDAHHHALLEVAGLLDDMTVLSPLADIIPLDTLAVSTHRANPMRDAGRWLSPARAGILLAGAALLAIFVLGQVEKTTLEPVLIANTKVGEYKTVIMDDGSRATLNTDSQINIDFGERERRITLTRGEAHFDVAPDKQRPFTVFAGNSIITAVGTAFNVDIRAEHVEVIVTEGLVEITSARAMGRSGPPAKEHSEAAPVQISAGERAIVAQEFELQLELLEPIDPVSVEKKLAWREGGVVFEGETLEEVVKEISRYTTTSFVIADNEIRKIRIGGYFETGDIEKMLDILANGFNIGARKSDSGVIYLSRLDAG